MNPQESLIANSHKNSITSNPNANSHESPSSVGAHKIIRSQKKVLIDDSSNPINIKGTDPMAIMTNVDATVIVDVDQLEKKLKMKRILEIRKYEGRKLFGADSLAENNMNSESGSGFVSNMNLLDNTNKNDTGSSGMINLTNKLVKFSNSDTKRIRSTRKVKPEMEVVDVRKKHLLKKTNSMERIELKEKDLEGSNKNLTKKDIEALVLLKNELSDQFVQSMGSHSCNHSVLLNSLYSLWGDVISSDSRSGKIRFATTKT